MPQKPQTHRPAGQAQAARRERQRFDRERGSAHARGYTRKWQVASKAFLRKHFYVCVACGGVACLVDHVIPHRGDQEKFWDEGNWACMCAPCHNRKTAKEVHG